jgi:hypothetical protein
MCIGHQCLCRQPAQKAKEKQTSYAAKLQTFQLQTFRLQTG